MYPLCNESTEVHQAKSLCAIARRLFIKADMQRFAFLIRPKEREALKRLSEAMDRSEGAVLRTLIRQAEHGLLLPADPQPPDLPQPGPREVRHAS